ncbi:hypothetical protein RSO01_33400 [Reyranella soli]|uniref:Uncharacterized protein n=1 Tax=Reyranella soli TaxID=1230389 RepID=A0A512NB58_9HYPH|nr:hypothetical protein RSO01_33400 [Reyranella soli]
MPFRLLRTDVDDCSSLYARPFVCKACGGRAVTLFAVEGQAELDMLRAELLPGADTIAPSNNRTHDPGADLKRNDAAHHEPELENRQPRSRWRRFRSPVGKHFNHGHDEEGNEQQPSEITAPPHCAIHERCCRREHQ